MIFLHGGRMAPGRADTNILPQMDQKVNCFLKKESIFPFSQKKTCTAALFHVFMKPRQKHVTYHNG
jgi:hypothetical protein